VGINTKRWYLKVRKNTMPTINHNGLTIKIKSQAMMKNTIRLFLAAFLTFGILNSVSSQDHTQMLPGMQQFFDNDGNPLSEGTVTTYVPNTSTLKTTYQDADGNVQNTNPIVLDAAGRAIIFGTGAYRQLVKDALGNIIWDKTTYVAGSGGGSSPSQTGDGDLVGTIKPWAGLTAPNQYVFAYGQELNRADYPELYTAITQTVNVNCTATSNTLTGIADTTQIRIGSPIEVSCVSGGTTVLSKTSSSVTVSNPANITLTALATFFPWGNGDGALTFNVPDLRDLALIGRPNMGGTDRGLVTSTYFGTTPGALGALGGSQSKTLVTGNLPPYTPSGTVTITDPGHTHDVQYTANLFNGGGIAATQNISSGGSSTGANAATFRTTGITAAFTGTAQGGTSTAFSIIQPSITTNYIIKVTPDENSAVATGVTSLGGMTGSIACGTGLLCTGNNVSVNIENIPTNQIYVLDYGYLPDGITDNTSAINSALSDAVARGGNVSIVFPAGTGLSNKVNTITANNIWFICEGGPGSCIITATDTNGLFQWGNASSVFYGGVSGLQFNGNGNSAQVLINLHQVQFITFLNVRLGNNVTGFMTVGTLSTYSGGVYVNQLEGKVTNTVAPLIKLINGAGFFLNDSNVFSENEAGYALDGHDVIQVFNSWNTISLKDNFFFLFNSALNASAASGVNIGDISIENNWLDQMNTAISIIAETNGAVGNISISSNQMTGKTGPCARVLLQPFPAQVLQFSFTNNIVRECKKEGLVIDGAITLGNISGNKVTQVSEPSSFTGSISGFTLTVSAVSGFPPSPLMVGDILTTTGGVAPNTTITALGTGIGGIGTYTVDISQNVASTSMTTTTSRYACLSMTTGSTNITMIGNSWCNGSADLGVGLASYGVTIAGGDNFTINGNAAVGTIGNWNITGLTNSQVVGNRNGLPTELEDAILIDPVINTIRYDSPIGFYTIIGNAQGIQAGSLEVASAYLGLAPTNGIYSQGGVLFGGSSSGSTQLNASAVASGTLTLPAATDTLIGRATTDTLTNKTLSSPALTGTVSGNNTIPLTILSQIATNTILGNATSGAANVTAQAMPSCSTSSSALNWTTNTGFGCNTSISTAIGNITGLGTGVATWLTTPSSANLASALTDKTGSGLAVFNTSPSLTTPNLGVATATSINGVTLDNNAWTSYTPTVTSSIGTITSYSATGVWKQIGKILFYNINVSITNNGTGDGLLRITLPTNVSARYWYAGGQTVAVSIDTVGCFIAPSTNLLECARTGATYPGATGELVIVTGTAEIP
jgi:hypothetical protein